VSLKILANSSNNSERSTEFLFRLSFSLIGQFFPVYKDMSKPAFGTISGSWADFGTSFTVTGDYLKAGKQAS
jgi:hypothetical protein